MLIAVYASLLLCWGRITHGMTQSCDCQKQKITCWVTLNYESISWQSLAESYEQLTDSSVAFTYQTFESAADLQDYPGLNYGFGKVQSGDENNATGQPELYDLTVYEDWTQDSDQLYGTK